MASRPDSAGVQPWPRNWLCADEVRRDLSVFRPEQWEPTRNLAPSANVGRYKERQFYAERGRAASSLGRPLLPELSAQLRVGRRRGHD